ncbi:SAM-dependent methyltransferase [Streptomyces sp. NPDC005122]
MDIAAYVNAIATAESRSQSYDDMVRFYYDFATTPYRDLWGDSFHLSWFAPGQDLRAAQQAQELWVAESGGFGPDMRVLDIGCGVGGPARYIAAQTGAHVTGVNISPCQVEIAERTAGELGKGSVRFELGDAMRLPDSWHGSFDGAYSIEALCHTPDKAQAYREVAQVLRPGAAFTGCDWFCRDGIDADDYARALEPLCQMLALPNLISMAKLRNMLAAAGLTVESTSTYQDYGDVTPNWELFDHVGRALTGSGTDTGTEQILRDSLALLRGGSESGDFVLGCWVARKSA